MTRCPMRTRRGRPDATSKVRRKEPNEYGNKFADMRLPERDSRIRPLREALSHEGAVQHAKAAMADALRTIDGLALAEFSRWPQFFPPRAPGAPRGQSVIKPDGYLRIRHSLDRDKDIRGEEHFFLELDRGMDARDQFIEKLKAYSAYDASPAFARFVGAASWEPSHFRVLIIFGHESEDEDTAAERRNSFLHAACGFPHPQYLAWTTTYAEFVRDPLAPIWLRAHDYGAALAGTYHNPLRKIWLLGRERSHHSLLRERAVKRALWPDMQRRFEEENS